MAKTLETDHDIQKGYIGVTHNVDERWETHMQLSETTTDNKLYNAMRKRSYIDEVLTDQDINGNDDIYQQAKGSRMRCIVFYSGLEKTEAYQLERRLIADYNLVDVGLNSQEGGSITSDANASAEHFIYYIFSVKEK